MTILFELTDTFGGEANYSWVRRATVKLDNRATNRQILKEARKLLELGSVKLRKAWDSGAESRYDLDHFHQCLFISFE